MNDVVRDDMKESRRLLLVCPTSGQLVDTGVRLDSKSLGDHEPNNGRTFCHHCAREHRWKKECLVLEVKPEPEMS